MIVNKSEPGQNSNSRYLVWAKNVLMIGNKMFVTSIKAICIAFLLESCHTTKQASKESTKAAGNYAKLGPAAYGRRSVSAYSEDVRNYLKLYGPVAVVEMRKYGVPASIILAQGIHESRAGKSVLATVANNHFGIKCTGDWTGDSFHMDDDRPNECFRKYLNPETSFNDHMLFLQRKHYSSLFLINRTDYKGWAYGLKKCGYATNPRYAEILITMIERYQLDRFDMGSFNPGPDVLSAAPGAETGTKPPASSPAVRDGNVAKAVIARSTDRHSFLVTDTIHRKVYVTDTVYQYAYQKAIAAARPQTGVHNSTVGTSSDTDGTTYKVHPGDTLYRICKHLSLNIDEVRRLNNLPDYGVKVDQVLKLPR